MICGKTIYQTRQTAIDSIDGQHKDKRHIKSKVKPCYSYFCIDCNGWHITTNESKKPKKKFVQDHTETLNNAGKFKRKGIEKSGNAHLIIHSRLNFKVK